MHEVHHSSEYFNLAVSLRQHVLQQYVSALFWAPAALFIPPGSMLVHYQLTTLAQAWVHSSVIPRLGVLEWVLVTPSHHKVHHGSNRYALDKNYGERLRLTTSSLLPLSLPCLHAGGVLIVWDRMFGTFAEERDEVVFGLSTNDVKSFNTLWTQVDRFILVARRFKAFPTIADKLGALWKGPGFIAPGKPRLGSVLDTANKRAPIVPFSRTLPLSTKIYVAAQFAYTFVLFQQIATHADLAHPETAVAYVVLAIASLGFVLDCHPSAPFLEALRHTATLAVYAIFRSLAHSSLALPWALVSLLGVLAGVCV